jgi:hypothetical protein
MTNKKTAKTAKTDKEVQQVINEYVYMVLWLITDGKYEGYSNESLGKLIRERLNSKKETSIPTWIANENK